MENKENSSILIVDDDPIMVRILSNILAEFTPLRFATSGKTALQIARQATPDLVLMDIEMPVLNGFEVCKQFKADKSLSSIPIIFLSSHERADLQTAGLKLGAVDFITKPPNAALVVARVRTHLRTQRLLSDTFRNAVTMDFVTGTTNRLQFERMLQKELVRARRSEQSLCLMLVEINAFSALETERGEDLAENTLREVAQVLRNTVRRPADVLARYAAGTFAALLPETDLAGAKAVARQAYLEVELANTATPGGHTERFSVCIGIGCSADILGVSSENAKPALMAAAERALAQAQNASRVVHG